MIDVLHGQRMYFSLFNARYSMAPEKGIVEKALASIERYVINKSFELRRINHFNFIYLRSTNHAVSYFLITFLWLLLLFLQGK